QIAATPDGATLLVTCYNNAIAFIDAASDRVVHTLSADLFFPNGIAISPDGSRAYVTNYFAGNPAPSLLVIDVVRRTILDTIPLPAGFPGVVVLTPDGSRAWVNYYQANFLDMVDTLTVAAIARIDFGEVTQNGMAFNPTGTKAFVATGSSHLAVVDTATLQVVTKITVSDVPLDVAVSPDGALVLVGSYSTGAIS